MERRSYNRYRLCLPALFTWSDPSGALVKEGGFTLDINPCGVYVITRSCPPVGTEIDVELFLLFDQMANGRRSATLAAKMRVLRVKNEDGEGGFAAAGLFNFAGDEDTQNSRALA